jgi:GNAT superfamily N-acetyltransferase
VKIRDARGGDEPELASLATELGYPATPEEIARRLPFVLAGDDQRLLVAVDADDRAIGWIHVALSRTLENDPYAQIMGLVVTAAERSAGIGAQLLAEAEAWARAQGVGSMRVRSNVTRERTHAFYLRAGYAIAKTSYLFVKQIE